MGTYFTPIYFELNSGKMVNTCCVKGCYNRFGKVKKRLFRVPATTAKCKRATKNVVVNRHNVWLSRIYGVIPEEIPKDLRVCEDHFISGTILW